MSRFNLIDEPWIKVMINKKGETKLVSLDQLFKNAPSYIDFAGDMKMQDFALLRFLLAILHTVYSRFDAVGEKYEYLELDEKYRPVNDLEEYEEEYREDLWLTWRDLWDRHSFSSIIEDYFRRWHDHFYLYDDEFPFYQITEKELEEFEITHNKPGATFGKMFNRTLTESENKVALFSPVKKEYKDKLENNEVARWLVLFQGCIGTMDKTKFIYNGQKVDGSKGWVYDLGGVSLKGKNIFETLMLNLSLVHPKVDITTHQNPSWENSGKDNVLAIIKDQTVDNLAEIYTSWGRAILIDNEFEHENNFKLSMIKLPDIEHRNQFLELMTLWRYNKQGDNKDSYTPRKHTMGHSSWRSFGSIFIDENTDDGNIRPGIIDWLFTIEDKLDNLQVGIETYSMMDDGNATSWVPTDEYYDILTINDYILSGGQHDSGWIYRIDSEVNLTKKIIDGTLRRFYKNIMEIRNVTRPEPIINNLIRETYFEIDGSFINWLNSIDKNDEKNEKVLLWRNNLEQFVIKKAEEMLFSATHRDYKGVTKNERVTNIATIYDELLYWLKRELRNL